MEDLHGTPAYVKRNSDGLICRVKDIFFDGDRKGYAVKILTTKGFQTLFPGEYRTFSIYYWNDRIELLTIVILE